MDPGARSVAPAMASAVSEVRVLAREHRGLLIVLVLGLIVRAAIVWATVGLPLRIVDEQHYHELAGHLRHEQAFAMDTGPTSMRPPLYPLFVAAIWTLSGRDSLEAVRIAQGLLGLLNVVLLYVIGLRLYGRRVAVLSAAGLCFYPSLLFLTALLLSEVLFTLLLTATVLAYVALVEKPRAALALATGLALGLAALTRSVMWPLIFALVPLVFLTTRSTRARRAQLAVWALVGYAVVVVPWAARNTRLQGTVTVIDTLGGLNLHMGNYEYTPFDRMWDAVSLEGERHWAAPLRREHPDVSIWTEGQKEKWAQERAIAYMSANPWLTLKRSLVKFADFWGLERELLGGFRQGLYAPPPWLALMAVALVGLTYVGAVLLASIGIFVAPPADRRAHILLLLLIVAMCAVHTIVFGHSRYHVPLMPILLLYAAAACQLHVWQRMRRRIAVAAVPVFTMALMLTIWLRELLVVDRGRLEELWRMIT